MKNLLRIALIMSIAFMPACTEQPTQTDPNPPTTYGNPELIIAGFLVVTVILGVIAARDIGEIPAEIVTSALEGDLEFE